MSDHATGSGRAVSAQNFHRPKLQHAMAQSRQRVYDAFARLGPATTNQIIRYLQDRGLDNDLDGKSTSSRVTELVAAGLLRVLEKVQDPVSGYLARQMVAVDPADAVPTPQNMTKQELQDQVADLRVQLRQAQADRDEAIRIANALNNELSLANLKLRGALIEQRTGQSPVIHRRKPRRALDIDTARDAA